MFTFSPLVLSFYNKNTFFPNHNRFPERNLCYLLENICNTLPCLLYFAQCWCDLSSFPVAEPGAPKGDKPAALKKGKSI